MIDEAARERVLEAVNEIMQTTTFKVEDIGYSLIFWGSSIGISEGYSKDEIMKTVENTVDEWITLRSYLPTLH